MRVLSVDQSYRAAGIVLLEDGEISFCEKYVTDKDEDIFFRARQLATRIQLIALKHQPDKIAIEGLSFGSTGNVTRDLAGLLFTIVILLREDSYEPIIVPPTTVKKFATGKGNSKKDMLIKVLPPHVRELFDSMNLKKTTGLGDLTDAYWIGKYVENNC